VRFDRNPVVFRSCGNFCHNDKESHQDFTHNFSVDLRVKPQLFRNFDPFLRVNRNFQSILRVTRNFPAMLRVKQTASGSTEPQHVSRVMRTLAMMTKKVIKNFSAIPPTILRVKLWVVRVTRAPSEKSRSWRSFLFFYVPLSGKNAFFPTCVWKKIRAWAPLRNKQTPGCRWNPNHD